ncbi:anti-sigma factor [Thalassobacillus sp. CUG 92003]|uniref:anti-sigma factor family protein n=1 Tax=Thalassobacillus sp. CUG 92003 TaxID=2736641 RepID=UPI0015E699F0|nr:zf-HC2 domain-containing protein [Thalassobacillus sp. CUG 92003]
MEHLHVKRLRAYIHDDIAPEERSNIEAHLDDCPDCFMEYLGLIDQWEPDLSLSEDFTDKTMEQWQTQAPKKHVRPSMTRKQTLLHYGVAAGLTIILMSTGVFQHMIEWTGKHDEPSGMPLTEKIMNSTNAWLDEMKEREGNE